ncbi:ParB N-terminal domain-containing protein [Schaalia sp. ORNL0103]|uniref:ParB N-terminal domain-containing protein n=1 Tax=Schaalia sp. ORNL0103 TaxID=2789426 RepID=UPI001CA5D822|nr:ParB N-terminal domain-containing protein [Schaalia sp. ORNL0103]MBW6412029.1 ParB N-terminal domain-containing protein [Schaalia sp. ORNL0103]
MTEAIAIAADDVQARTVAETMLGLVADDGHVEVAQAELARLTGLSARTLRRALDRLREAHWISVVREATPNAPARYDLTDLAAVAQAVGLKPRREEPEAVASTGTGVLSAEVAADPIGAVQPGQRWLIDPTLLQAGSNIRADLRVGPEFVETIAGLGVLKDIDVYPTLTGLVVLDGHRRHRAAIEAGLEMVPVRIVDVANDLDRIGLQLTENDEHAHTSTVDRARAINQLVLMGLPASELRKRGVKASEATLARRVANASQEVADLGESASLGLDDLAKIAEAEADLPEDIAGMVVEEIREAPGKIDHFLERARDEARRRRVYEDAVLELRQQGVKVIREDEFYDGFPKSNQFLWNLVDEYGNSVEPHDNCPGNVAYVSVIGSGDYTNVQTRFVCLDYASHGHFTREDRARTTQEADRAATVEANRQAAQEGEVRRAWIKDVLLKRPLPKDTALLEMPVIYNQAQVSDASQAKGRALIGFDDLSFGLTMSAAQAAKARLAWCIGVLEGGMGRDYWRSRNGERFDSLVQLYLRTLERWGYPLGEGEEAFCEKVEAAPAIITWGPRAGEVY